MHLNCRSLITIFFFFLLFPFWGFSQRSASTSFIASVTIIEPLEIQNTADMNFASIEARNGGTVTLNPDNTRSGSGNLMLDDAAAVSAATFEIKGQAGYSFDLSLPKGKYVLVNGIDQIGIRDFTSDLISKYLVSGSETVRLGATLDIGPQQKPGVYTSPAPIEVTVNYN